MELEFNYCMEENMGLKKKKEPKKRTQGKNIISVTSALFMEKGIAATSMDDIAKAAGYNSKATLYVYFENKEEIVGILVLNSMKKLYDYISAALAQHESTETRYSFICRSLVQYQGEFPFFILKWCWTKSTLILKAKTICRKKRKHIKLGKKSMRK